MPEAPRDENAGPRASARVDARAKMFRLLDRILQGQVDDASERATAVEELAEHVEVVQDGER